MKWETIERPGYFGKKKSEKIKQYDDKYGKGNWRLMWHWLGQIVPKEWAYQIYEDAYYEDSYKREGLWKELASEAKDVYDFEEKDTESGLDYLVQKGPVTHLQDIAVRRVFFRRGWQFKGNELIQIRGSKDYWGENLNPGRLEFHEPHLIINPHLLNWWNENSIEDWYQSNKILQAREPVKGLRIFVVCSKHNYIHLPPILAELKERGHDPTPPNCYDDPFKEDKLRQIDEQQVRLWKQDMIRLQDTKIAENDAILVMNLEKKGQPNYIGGATFLEIFKAWERGKKIFMYNSIPDSIFRDELDAIEPVIINGDLSKIA